MAEDWNATCLAMEASHQALSRTFHGLSDTQSSAKKRPLKLQGQELARQTSANAQELYSVLLRLRSLPAPLSAEEVSQRMEAIETAVNRGLLPAGRFRTWNPESNDRSPFAVTTPWQEVPIQLDQLCQELYRRWREDPVVVAAWLEWTIQGPIHPYYDGCGRISRGLSAWILLGAGQPVPRYRDREEWFLRARQGLDSFTEFVRDSCRA